ncbi:hypothetical protein [Pseudolysinimonas sp.]|jgi:hypothetical protein|uniref:hypothetical protein n=1 Tax=Pseudolysinimonas sp. TaxID=2680009 RepID=UPI0037840EEC
MNRRLPFFSAALLLPGTVTVAGVVATASLAAGASRQIAVHWNALGEPDGYAAPEGVVAAVALGGIAVTVGFAALLLLGRSRTGIPTRSEKILVTAASFVTALTAAIGVWMLAAQRTDGARVDVWPGLVVGFGIAGAVGLTAWLITPRADRTFLADPASEPPVPLSSTERAVWIGTARMPRPAVAAIGLATLAVLALVAGAVIASDLASWPVLLVPAALGIFLLGLSSYAVRVDDDGLHVRAALGVPVWNIPAARVASAGVAEVAPLADFGGWGVRIGRGGRTGVITRRGSALQLRRRDGRALVVTVDDAGTAAALLGAVAERAATAGGRG